MLQFIIEYATGQGPRVLDVIDWATADIPTTGNLRPRIGILNYEDYVEFRIGRVYNAPVPRNLGIFTEQSYFERYGDYETKGVRRPELDIRSHKCFEVTKVESRINYYRYKNVVTGEVGTGFRDRLPSHIWLNQNYEITPCLCKHAGFFRAK